MAASDPNENLIPAKVPMVQGTPESHLPSETNPQCLSEFLKWCLMIQMRDIIDEVRVNVGSPCSAQQKHTEGITR